MIIFSKISPEDAVGDDGEGGGVVDSTTVICAISREDVMTPDTGNGTPPIVDMGAYEYFDYDGDGDGIPNDVDNCPNTPNPDQLDTYPPQQNGIGDVCDCEADFNCNGSVDSLDVYAFIYDVGRNPFNYPCTNEDPCNGDFNCDQRVASDDVDILLEDTGRNQFNNPCPACTPGPWCVYP